MIHLKHINKQSRSGNMELNHEIARDLLSIQAVQIKTDSYFTWTSGIKSPIYCDNPLTMSYPAVRKKIMKVFIQKIKKMDEKPDVIAGCATAGIPHAAWLAEGMELPMIYVRSKPKGHGKENLIEGTLEKGQKVLVIEDLISTGGSSIKAAQAVQEHGGKVIDILSIFTYGLDKAKQQFLNARLSYQSLTNYDEVLHILVEDGKIDDNERKQLEAWRNEL